MFCYSKDIVLQNDSHSFLHIFLDLHPNIFISNRKYIAVSLLRETQFECEKGSFDGSVRGHHNRPSHCTYSTIQQAERISEAVPKIT